MVTHKMAKINFINSGAVDIIRTTYYIHGLELMKLIFAGLYMSRTMGLTRCYKTERFFTFITVKYFDNSVWNATTLGRYTFHRTYFLFTYSGRFDRDIVEKQLHNAFVIQLS